MEGTSRPAIAVRRFSASAGELHALPMPTRGGAELWIMRPTAPALVMGSAQRPDQFDVDRLRRDGVELAARRSGGGAVFIDPDETVWVDLVAPRDSEWWSAELAETFCLVGRRWQLVLSGLGVSTDLVEQPPTHTPASRLACWVGLGWGELTIRDTKVLGLSQRRTRWGSRVQALASLGGSSARVADYLLAPERALLAGSFPHDRGAVAVFGDAALDRDVVEAAVIAGFAL